ncbi:MAG: hypothetical protein ACRDRL_18460, partial [Sciscionella sp.]
MGRTASTAHIDRLYVHSFARAKTCPAATEQTGYCGQRLPVINAMPTAGALSPHVSPPPTRA